MEGKICSLTQTCRNVNREWTLHIERLPRQRSTSLDDKTWSLPWGRTRDTAPHQMNTKYDSKWILPYIHYIISSGLWPNITYITKSVLSRRQAVLQCVQSRRGQIYGWDSGSMLPVQCVLVKGNNLPLLWYLGKWKILEESKDPKESVKCFVKFFHTQTLRLVSPLGMPRHLHTLQGTYPIAQYTAYPSGDCHTA